MNTIEYYGKPYFISTRQTCPDTNKNYYTVSSPGVGGVGRLYLHSLVNDSIRFASHHQINKHIDAGAVAVISPDKGTSVLSDVPATSKLEVIG